MNVLALFKNISTFIFDVDGVLTDGYVLLHENGEQQRRMYVKDGLALQMAIKNGFKIVIVSGASSQAVLRRLKYLHINEVHLGVADKKIFLDKYINDNKLRREELLFMGDDLPDLACMETVGVAACPADAVPEIKSVAHYISSKKGGSGCVRELIEKVLRVQDKWIFDPQVAAK